MQYSAGGNAGAASTTAATAGIIKCDNPSSSTMAAAKINEWKIGPQANSADENYGVRVKRQSTAGTWTAVTARPNDEKAGAAVTAAGVASTAAGTAGVELDRVGFHMRGGYRWVAIPGGELVVPLTFSAGILIEYIFAQGTSVLGANVQFNE